MDQQDSSIPGQVADMQSPFRLSINHLLLLTLTISVSMACMAPGIEQFLAKPIHSLGGREWRSIVAIVVGQVAIGVSLFGWIVVLRNWTRRRQNPSVAGDSILLALGPVALFELIYRPLPLFLQDRMSDVSFRWFILLSEAAAALVNLWGGIVCYRAATQSRERSWKVSLVVMGTWLFTLALFDAMHVAAPFVTRQLASYSRHTFMIWATLNVVVIVAILVAAVIDRLQRVPRDWLHITAIVAVLLNAVPGVVLYYARVLQWWSSVMGWLRG